MAFDEDLSELFDTNDFAETAIVTGKGTLKGIFEHAYVEVQGIEGYSPVFHTYQDALDALSTPIAHGDIVNVRSTLHYVRGVQPDGTGLVDLILEKSL